jgi:hypothetical protein
VVTSKPGHFAFSACRPVFQRKICRQHRFRAAIATSVDQEHPPGWSGLRMSSRAVNHRLHEPARLSPPARLRPHSARFCFAWRGHCTRRAGPRRAGPRKPRGRCRLPTQLPLTASTTLIGTFVRGWFKSSKCPRAERATCRLVSPWASATASATGRSTPAGNANMAPSYLSSDKCERPPFQQVGFENAPVQSKQCIQLTFATTLHQLRASRIPRNLNKLATPPSSEFRWALLTASISGSASPCGPPCATRMTLVSRRIATG